MKKGILALNRYIGKLSECSEEGEARRLLTKAKCDMAMDNKSILEFEGHVERFVVNKRLIAYER